MKKSTLNNPANPTVIYAGAPASRSMQSELIDKLFKVGIGVGLFYVGREIYYKWLKNKSTDEAGGNPNIQAAIAIYNAINGGGTNEEELFDTASKITDWPAVTSEFRNRYHKDLLDEVKSDLSSYDFQRFMNLYNLTQKDKDGNIVSQKNTIVKGAWVFIEKEANIRKTPRYMKVTDKLKEAIKNPLSNRKNNTNVIALAKPGKYLGFATGRTVADTESPQATLYIEVGTIGLDAKTKAPFNTSVWVASSQVRTEIKKDKPNPKDFFIIVKQAYDAALSGIGDNTNYSAELQTINPTVAVLDINRNLMGMASGTGTILGYKDAEYSVGGTDYYVFKTIQGLTRMVEKTHVKERKL